MRKRRPPKSQRPRPSKRQLVIDGLDAAGSGISGDILVPFALPGEEVEANVTGKTALVTRILQRSVRRQPPVCPHFGLPGDGCGGCTLQHLGAADVLTLKKERLLAALIRDYPEAVISGIHTSPPRSRRRARFAVTPKAAGFRQYKSDCIVSLLTCDVVHPDLFAVLSPLHKLSKGLGQSFDAEVTLTAAGLDVGLVDLDEERLSYDDREVMADLVRRQDWARLTLNGVPLLEVRTPYISFGGVPVSLPPGVFLQATGEAEEALIGEVTEPCEGSGKIADLFCGVGTFALPLSQLAPVYAVDGAPEAIAALAAAAKRHERPIETDTRDLFRRPLTSQELSGFDAVVFDPPRAGARDQAIMIAAAAPKTIVAVSCNPATLARDARLFTEGYTLDRLVMVDQFGWSSHIEAVAVFRRRS